MSSSRPRRPTPPLATALLLVVAFAAIAAGVVIDKPVLADGPKPLGRDCHLQGGVRFCGGSPDWTGGGRVDSWDGFPSTST